MDELFKCVAMYLCHYLFKNFVHEQQMQMKYSIKGNNNIIVSFSLHFSPFQNHTIINRYNFKKYKIWLVKQ